MTNASQALVLKFSTDLAGAQDNIAKFAAKAYLDFEKISTAAKNAKTILDAVGKGAELAADKIAKVPANIAIGTVLATSLVAGVIALHGFIEAVEAAEAALDKLNKIGAGAASAGVGTAFFQGWVNSAKELNHETSDMVAMLEKFREASTQSIQDAGKAGDKHTGSSGEDRIKQNMLAGNLGADALSNFNGAATEEARARVVLALLDQMKEKGAQLAAFDLAKHFFGDKFETDLRNGVDMIGQMRAKLDGVQAAGGERIIPDKEIQNAKQMQAELNDISNRLATVMAPFSDHIAATHQEDLVTLIALKEDWVSIVEEAGKLLKFTDDIGASLRSWANSIGNAQIFKDINSFLDKMGLMDHSLLGPALTPPGDQAPAITVHGDKSKRLPSLDAPKAAPAAATSKADEVDTYIKSLEKLNATEQAEAQTLGLGNKAKQEAVDLAKALEAAATRGTALTQKEKDQVKALADSYIDAKDKIDAFAKAEENAKATGEFFGQTLESAIEKLSQGGGNLKSVLLDVVKALEQAALKAALLGQGPLASLFGTAASGTGTAAIGGIFGQLVNAFPKFAAGGDLAPGHFGIAGEAGPELIQGPAAITPFKAINTALASGGSHAGAINVNHTSHIDARGAQIGVADQIQSAMQKNNQYLVRNLPAILQNSHSRFS
jgi:hypothetical protein